VQGAVGGLLYYARAVGPTMLHATNGISLNASKGTQETLRVLAKPQQKEPAQPQP